MAHMICDCGNDLWDGDGIIVYQVYKKADFLDYIKDNGNCKFCELQDKYLAITEDNPYFWLCDKCKTVHLWSYIPKYCFRTFKICEISKNLNLEEIQKLDEYFIFNIYDDYDEYFLTDIIKKNPIRPYKYYVKKDLTKVYIINTDKNEIDRVYELTYESFVEYDVETDFFDDLAITTIDKKNDEHEYEVKNGKRHQVDLIDYPHKQVNVMITEKDVDGGSISYPDSNIKPKTYTINTMDKFNEKYGKYYKKLKYFYVEYIDMVGDKLYCYKSSKNYNIGDIVKVPRGYNNEVTEAKIINIKLYTKDEVPYPYEHLKEILDEEEI